MMGGSGALMIFGGVGVGTFVGIGGALAAWKRWQSQRERALVLAETSSLRTFSETSHRVVDDAVFWTICASAYVVYYMKSWWRGHGGTTSRRSYLIYVR